MRTGTVDNGLACGDIVQRDASHRFVPLHVLDRSCSDFCAVAPDRHARALKEP